MKKKRKPNYIKKLDQAVADGTVPTIPGTVSIMHVYHDERCPVWDGGECSCDPDIQIEYPPIPKKD